MKSNTIECKEEFGLFTCKFNAQKIVFNAMTQKQISVNFFKTDNCYYCNPAQEQLKNILKPFNDMIHINVHNDDESARKHKVEAFPTTEIGDKRIVGIPDKEEIWDAVLSSSTPL